MYCSGDNLEIMGRGQELLKKTLAHENFRKMQVGINTFEENGFFLKKGNVACNIHILNKPRLGSDASFH